MKAILQPPVKPGKRRRSTSLTGFFTAAWALLAIGIGVWAARTNRRWVVTTATTFFAINFYTHWFERLGGEPWAVIIAGLTILGIAVGLWRYNIAPAAAAWSPGADA